MRKPRELRVGKIEELVTKTQKDIQKFNRLPERIFICGSRSENSLTYNELLTLHQHVKEKGYSEDKYIFIHKIVG